MDEPSVMGTENALMAAALTPGPTTIGNAACEPHVQDLARLLVRWGAQIDGIGFQRDDGARARQARRGGAPRFAPITSRSRAFMALAAATGGEMRIRDAEPQDLITIRRQFRRLGLQSMVEGNDIWSRRTRSSKSATTSATRSEDRRRPVARLPGRSDLDRPGAGDAGRGTILIFEKMFENRLFFVDKLVAMGARITLCDPHRAIVSGPSRLHGERVESPDIRAGMAMLIAALCAEGTSEIGNVVQIDRGYERIDERVAKSRGAHRARGRGAGTCVTGLASRR